MARDIIIDLRNGAGGTGDQFTGHVTIEPTRVFTSGATTILPTPNASKIIKGQATLKGVLPSPSGNSVPWAYRVTVYDLDGRGNTINVGVPDSTTPINLTALPQYEAVNTYEGEAYVQINKETGPRNVRTLWGGTGGNLTLTRSGNWVELSAWGIPFVSGSQYQMQVPAGFRPPDIRLFNEAIFGDGNPAGERMNVRGDGNIQVLGVTSGAQIYFTVQWYTREGMPDTLPGTAI